MKLSLYSQRVRNGARNEDVYNPDEMRRKLFDVKIEGVLQLSPDSKDMLCMLSVNALGCLVFLIKPLFSRMGDYRSLVLAVPRQIVFTSAKDIPSIVDDMRRVLAEEKDEGTLERWAPLAKWFEKDYAETDFNWPLAEGGDRYAYRVYGTGKRTLADLLGTSMLQDYYADFEGVFLLNATQVPLVRSNAMADISQKTIVAPAIVRPPRRTTIPKGAHLFVGKEEMTTPVLSHIGAKMRLALKKDHCQDMSVDFKVTEEDAQVQLPAQVVWIRKIPTNVFLLVDEEYRQIRTPGYLINIAEALPETNKNFIFIAEDVMHKVHVKASAPGYEDNSFEIDLAKVSKEDPLKVVLQRKRSKVKYKVGRDIVFEMARTSDLVEESPLIGYTVAEVKGNVVMLKREGEKEKVKGKEGTGKKNMKWNLYRIGTGLLGGLLIGFAVGWFPGVNHGVNTRNEELEQERLAQEQMEREKADSLERMRMVAYLDSVPNWKKESFDTIFGGKLQALYHNVNYFDFDKVQQLVEDLKIEDSKQLAQLDSVIDKMNENPEYLVRLQEVTNNEDDNHQKFFSKDGTITLVNLFKHLEEARKTVDQQKKP